ncbi:hypothetical protein JHK87_032880 [Glycine soja]|nr:hypothetical protein JHK87_032880 [Glycine soja]
MGNRGRPKMLRVVRRRRKAMRKYESSRMFLVETHASNAVATRIIPKTSFNVSFVKETRVQSRGIWCLWKSENWKVEILRSDDQYVHLCVGWKNQE